MVVIGVLSDPSLPYLPTLYAFPTLSKTTSVHLISVSWTSFSRSMAADDHIRPRPQPILKCLLQAQPQSKAQLPILNHNKDENLHNPLYSLLAPPLPLLNPRFGQIRLRSHHSRQHSSPYPSNMGQRHSSRPSMRYRRFRPQHGLSRLQHPRPSSQCLCSSRSQRRNFQAILCFRLPRRWSNLACYGIKFCC